MKMKQNIVIKVNMSSEKSRSKAMALVAKAEGVSSMGIIGDGNDRLEVVGVDVDVVRLVTCLRKKVGYADIVTVEEAKDKPEEREIIIVEQPPENNNNRQILEWTPHYCTTCNFYRRHYCHHHNH